MCRAPKQPPHSEPEVRRKLAGGASHRIAQAPPQEPAAAQTVATPQPPHPVSGLRPPTFFPLFPQLRPPPSGLRSPASGFRPPVSGLRSPASGLRLPVSGFRSPASALRPPNSSRYFRNSGLWPPASEFLLLRNNPAPSNKPAKAELGSGTGVQVRLLPLIEKLP